MIKSLLDPHDHERWTNKHGRRMPKPIKLYLEARVMQVEATETFAHARERASAHQVVMLKAVQTRQLVNTRALARYEALPLPEVQVHPVEREGKAADQKELWQMHLQEFYLWHLAQEHLLSGLTQTMRRAAELRMYQRYQAAVSHAYGWIE
ncbi:hypothetical protein [Deinococcus sp. QL22]|uniref:hypothetical protein n=1 Tax=Deinococcus sp. QL22 TaxID=2939437 RepID=UPI002016E849|nr:hypothetical protein [Deinococcus sp. QL22]UQN10114.1 hypothetical protein M1R55_28400 [Deinococcus sp. QL22]